MKSILVGLPDSSIITVCLIADESPQKHVAALVKSGALPKGAKVAAVDPIIGEQEARWFDAAEWKNGRLSVNTGKAKELHKSRLRIAREPLLAAQDRKRAQALRNGESTAAIDAETQRLCDITRIVSECATVNDIERITIDFQAES